RRERLRRMPPAERDLLEKAAACGEAFWLDAVVALVRAATLESDDPDGPTLADIAKAGDRSRSEAAEVRARLEQRGLIYECGRSDIPGERECPLAYNPLQEPIYGGIADSSRRQYHRLLAHWPELRPEGRHEDEQEEVGRHFERAGDATRAATRFRRAGDAA